MFSAPTTYRSGARTVEVLPGESHSDAWAYIVRGGPEPASYPCSSHAGAGRVRVRAHALSPPAAASPTRSDPCPVVGPNDRRMGVIDMRVVVALGGNALLRRGEPADAATQRRNVTAAVAAIADLARDHEVIVTHGNGPQVGLLALQGDAYHAVAPYPLDVLGAESEGMIGYLLDQELGNELGGRQVATLLTQVVVDRDDPAFAGRQSRSAPSTTRRRAAARRRARLDHRAPTASTAGAWSPSPEPQSIVELGTLRLLVEAGVLVVCVGGGGIPVAVDRDGRWRASRRSSTRTWRPSCSREGSAPTRC